MAKKVVDTEKMLDDAQNKKFGLSITNIVSLVTVLSGLIAGWYTFTGRIDSLEEVVQGFAEASDIEIVTNKIQSFDDDIVYLREKLDTGPVCNSYKIKIMEHDNTETISEKLSVLAGEKILDKLEKRLRLAMKS